MWRSNLWKDAADIRIENVSGEVRNLTVNPVNPFVRSVIDIIDFLVYLWVGLISRLNPYDDDETDPFLAMGDATATAYFSFDHCSLDFMSIRTAPLSSTS